METCAVVCTENVTFTTRPSTYIADPNSPKGNERDAKGIGQRKFTQSGEKTGHNQASAASTSACAQPSTSAHIFSPLLSLFFPAPSPAAPVLKEAFKSRLRQFHCNQLINNTNVVQKEGFIEGHHLG
jgi:hypothetical protein